MQRMIGWLACVGAVAMLVAAMVIGAAPAAAAGAGPRVKDAWVRLSAVPGRPAAGYFTLSAAAAPVELTGVRSPLARVELHGMSMAGGVMRMDALRSVKIMTGQTGQFAPGGAHLMLFDVPASVTPGAAIPLTFRFADGTTVRVDAVARGAADGAPTHGTH